MPPMSQPLVDVEFVEKLEYRCIESLRYAFDETAPMRDNARHPRKIVDETFSE